MEYVQGEMQATHHSCSVKNEVGIRLEKKEKSDQEKT